MMEQYLEAGSDLHGRLIVIDGLSYMYTGPTSRLNSARITATNLTVPETYHEFAETVTEIMRMRKLIASDPATVLVETTADITRAKRDGRVGLIMGFQATLPIGNDLDRVQLFRDLGIRIIQLTYNWRTFTGDGCLEPNDGGLSQFGRRLIRELERVGVVLDLSHGGQRTTLEAIEAAELPPVFTHSNPAAVTASERNVTDRQLKAVAERGGVVGICCWGPICWKNSGVQPSIDDYLDHIDYAVQLVGPDHVGIATDSPCTDTRMDLVSQHIAEMSEAFPSYIGEYNEQVGTDPPVRYPRGLFGIEDLTPVTGGLLLRGYSADDVRKIMGGNFMRVFGQVWDRD